MANADVAAEIKVTPIKSLSQSEGKTTAVANFAVALPQGGDCRFGVDLTPGHTDVLVATPASPRAFAVTGPTS